MSVPSTRPATVLLQNPALAGFEYGVQRDFEAAILRHTGGAAFDPPPARVPRLARRYSTVGTRYAPLLAAVPKTPIRVPCDDLWCVLMAPHDFPLWYHRGWDRDIGRTRLYLFDTFEEQFPTVKQLLAAGRWDQLVTSFPVAVPLLERATGRRWQAVLQGVDPARLHPLPAGAEPAIGFSSYGRRLPAVHDAVRRFCRDRGLYYDFSVAAGTRPGSDPRDAYDNYAWHLRQSWFNISYPVELTHPSRAGRFSPVTCRWFEAAASAAVVIGAAPTDPAFEASFGPGFVEPLDPGATPDAMAERLGELWDRRHELRAKRLALAAARGPDWTWDARVREMERLPVG